jgi:hypothetical protein
MAVLWTEWSPENADFALGAGVAIALSDRSTVQLQDWATPNHRQFPAL